MKRIFSLLFALSISSSPVFAWGWGDCPHSQKGVDQEAKSEKAEQSQSETEK